MKDPDRDTVFQLFELVAPHDEVEQLRQSYLAGGLGYGQAKQQLLDVLLDSFADARTRYTDILASEDELHRILQQGASRARQVARATHDRARDRIGIRQVSKTRNGG